MSEATSAGAGRVWLTTDAWRSLFRDRPIIPLTGLLVLLVLVFAIVSPRSMGPSFVAITARAAIPLALLAACQTLAMLTGGIDLSVGAVASMAGFVTAALEPNIGLPAALLIALVASAVAGLVNGVGAGVFRVHPLIMTLGMSLVVLGLANAFQLVIVKTSSGVPDEIRSIGADAVAGVLPYSLVIFAPVALLIILGLRRSGYGRMLFAIGDNPIAARLAGARAWQVLIVLYVISGTLAGIAGILISGFTNVAAVTLADVYVLPSVAAAVIGGTSILGGRGGYGGTIVGALILTVVSSLLGNLGFPEAVRQVLFGSIIVVVAAAYARVTGEA
jgi:ribose transport system permease protein